MYQVTGQYSPTPLFEGSKSACRKFLQASVSGRLRKAANHDWADERNVFCWCTQTDREFNVTKISGATQ